MRGGLLLLTVTYRSTHEKENDKAYRRPWDTVLWFRLKSQIFDVVRLHFAFILRYCGVVAMLYNISALHIGGV